MKNMTTFTKWFLLNAVVLTGLFFAEQKGAISLMVKNDVSHITILIMLLYLLVSVYVGRLCYLSDKINPKKRTEAIDHLFKRADLGWFAAEHFFSLGLLGTIFGLCVATTTNLSGEAPVAQVVAGLKEGLNTAFYTTICGIIFSLPLQVQLMILKFKLEEEEPEEKDD
jgi:Ca2+/Na+ antiporter|tara:strand:+ start:1883 stop:2386 length:504 start_codon:yes stop_codon:yes gene_type:complete